MFASKSGLGQCFASELIQGLFQFCCHEASYTPWILDDLSSYPPVISSLTKNPKANLGSCGILEFVAMATKEDLDVWGPYHGGPWGPMGCVMMFFSILKKSQNGLKPTHVTMKFYNGQIWFVKFE